jgi:hypothetical protein
MNVLSQKKKQLHGTATRIDLYPTRETKIHDTHSQRVGYINFHNVGPVQDAPLPSARPLGDTHIVHDHTFTKAITQTSAKSNRTISFQSTRK